MKSPSRKRAEELQNELTDVMGMLQKEGQSDGERRYKKIMAEIVLLILLRLDSVSTAVLVVFGMVLGHILGNIF